MFLGKKIYVCLNNVKHQDLSNFHPLEVVGRCSDTQLQAGEN